MSSRPNGEKRAAPSFGLVLEIGLCLTLWLGTPTFAQQTPEAARFWNEARAVVAEAEARYAGTVLNIDQPLWRRAIDLGEQSLAASPDNPETTLFLAQTYSRIGWFIRAWPRWQSYLAAGGTLNPDDAGRFAKTGTELGFSRYSVGDLGGALPYFQTVAEVLPDNPEALSWLGRILLEQSDPAAALPYWERLASLDPANGGFTFYRDLTNEQLQVGPAASAAFRSGLSAYDAGDLETALEDFKTATANPQFTEAFTWAARTSGELERFDEATALWQQVLELAPDNASAKYFLGFIKDQKQWGAAAASAFYEGQKAYQEDDLVGAAERFDAAARFNPAYKDAAVWTARSLQELGQADKALVAWRTVLKLDPADKRAAYFLNLAEQQLAYGSEAGRAFVQGVEQFEVANLTEAETLFQEAVQTNPDFAEAWAWLGRTRFTSADYAAAAVAYEKAAELAPDNDDYRFFADEAAFLADAE
ncbi:hypothetical protein BH24DEI2_BH24DEI2_23070 [soil metagenome]